MKATNKVNYEFCFFKVFQGIQASLKRGYLNTSQTPGEQTSCSQLFFPSLFFIVCRNNEVIED